MRVMFLGDTHANLGFITRAFGRAWEQECEAIIQVGDFGWWPRHRDALRFIDGVADLANDLPLYFVDGNHEDHDTLPHDRSVPIELRSGLTYLPRGSVLELGDSRILGFGGAVSVDQDWRTPGVNWFDTEISNAEQRLLALSRTEIDIVVAHDAPHGTSLSLTYPTTPQIEAQSMVHREFCRELLDVLSPTLWVAGHYHQRATTQIGSTTVEVLPHDMIRLEDSSMVREV